MPHVHISLDELKSALQKRRSVLITPKGFWFDISFLNFLSFLGLDRFIKAYNAKNFCKILDEQEKIPLKLPDEMGLTYASYGSIAKELLNAYFDDELAWRQTALEYRLEITNGGMCPTLEKSESPLIEYAEAWKESMRLLWHQKLNANEKIELEKTLGYTAFIDLLEKAPRIREKFFEWVIVDHLPAEVFIQYPHVVNMIYEAKLAGRIGTVGGHKLKIQKVLKGRSRYKIVTLPFEGKEVSILDTHRMISFRGGLSLTIQEIFKLFSEKPNRFVDVEYFAQGITNWNAQHVGYFSVENNRYESINLDQYEWWRQLPPLDILTFDEAKERYGEFVTGKNWIAAAKAARGHLDLSYDKCHTYLEIAIPGKDVYFVYEFGKFARYFPYGVVDNLRMFTITTPATIAYPDENIYHTRRQQVGYCFSLHHYQGLTLMEEIRQDMCQARTGNMVFQIEADNCGQWIQTHVEDILDKKNVPNLFRVTLLKSDARGLVGLIFRLIKFFPSLYHAPLLTFFHFGASRGQFIIDPRGRKIYKSLASSSFWKDIIVYHPAILHMQKEKGRMLRNDEMYDLDDHV